MPSVAVSPRSATRTTDSLAQPATSMMASATCTSIAPSLISGPVAQVGIEKVRPPRAPGEVELPVERGRVPEGREVDRQSSRWLHPRPGVALGDDRAPDALALDRALDVHARELDHPHVGRRGQVAGEMVEVD